ncbi:MAG: threonylcarbamoyl-AMP synthase [Beijerinckiaceae bacterium]|nr:threonylcarbamoyl-AMP synthase [Beijerinckiaceae bacterium]
MAQDKRPADRDTLRIDPDATGIARAAALLRAGKLVAFPTETVYGLGADARQGEAVAGIYEAKGRPSFNPLIAHVPDLAAADRIGVFDATARQLAEHFWPGPLTLVVPLRPDAGISALATAGLNSIALRVPSHPVARELLALAQTPIVAPSANRSGRVSPTEAEHVWSDLSGRIDAVVEGWSTPVGVESTIVSCLGPRPVLLRPGGVTRAEIEEVLGERLADGAGDAAKPIAPGLLESHYAPRAKVRLNAQSIAPGEAALLFGPDNPAGLEDAKAQLNLSFRGDLREAAANLFAMLRRLDLVGAATIAVAPIPAEGLGEAIRDRLQRAAAPRS